MMPTCSFCLVSLLLATTTLTCSGAYDVTNTDELWKKVERLTDTSDTLNDQLHNLTRDVSEHTRRLDDMDSPATLPVREAWLSALEALVTRLVDNTDAMDSVRAQVQTLTTDTQNMEQQLLDMRAQGDNLTLEIQRLKVWLERECAKDRDCGVELSRCFKGKCLCSPGYYYSRTKNICQEMCSYNDLQPTFIKYPNCVISGYNMLSFPSSLEECLSRCAANPRCRTVDYPQAGGTCYLQPVTALDVNMASEWQTASSTYDNYQRTCL